MGKVCRHSAGGANQGGLELGDKTARCSVLVPALVEGGTLEGLKFGVRGQRAMPPCLWRGESSWGKLLVVASGTASWSQVLGQGKFTEKGSLLRADTGDEQLAVPEMGAGKGEDWEGKVRHDHFLSA